MQRRYRQNGSVTAYLKSAAVRWLNKDAEGPGEDVHLVVYLLWSGILTKDKADVGVHTSIGPDTCKT